MGALHFETFIRRKEPESTALSGSWFPRSRATEGSCPIIDKGIKLLTAVNTCTRDVNATLYCKELLDLILRPPTKGVMVSWTMTMSSACYELYLLCVMSMGLPCKVIGLDKETFRRA
jgi:hypothetical protein